MTSIPSQPPQVTLDLDAAALDPICEFYARLLGYRVVRTDHAGTLIESRTLTSDQVPALRLRFRCCAPRPPMGAAIGTIRLITFHVSDPLAVAARIEKPIWILPPPDDATTLDRVILQDSSGYHVALAHPQEDSACTDANPPGTGSSSRPAASS
jgi:hypothetical protein